MKIKVEITSNPNEPSSHMRRTIFRMFRLMGLSPVTRMHGHIMPEARSGEWHELTAEAPQVPEALVDPVEWALYDLCSKRKERGQEFYPEPLVGSHSEPPSMQEWMAELQRLRGEPKQ